jgi:hypothetical protein
MVQSDVPMRRAPVVQNAGLIQLYVGTFQKVKADTQLTRG